MDNQMESQNSVVNPVTPDKNNEVEARENVKITTSPVENSGEVSKKDLDNAFSGKKKGEKSWIVMLIIGILGLAGGGVMAALPFLLPKEIISDLTFPKIPSVSADEGKIYSHLTGLEVSSAADLTAPAYCIQTPNGLDGARPQAGMNQAGVVFEAIAEAGITRFAAIYQAPTSAVIGPLRSLRLYYLEWDTPFDCTIVHAGGAPNAIEAVQAGGYKDMSENYVYMYRGNYPNYDRLWNNLFTNSALLGQFASDTGYTSSNINGFSRMTPDEAYRARVDATVAEKLNITQPATASTSTLTPKVTHASMAFGGYPSFNVVYDYDAATNTYNRSYASGEPHYNYVCPDGNLGEIIPEGTCELRQLSPAVVVAMSVNEYPYEDNYHQVIETVGTGDAVILQNGLAIRGHWSKSSVADQIRFYDENGAEVRLVPGQTFVEAVPLYGSIEL